MSVRDIEARLAGSVEDRVSQRLGYRETEVRLLQHDMMTLLTITPRPAVTELTPAAANRRMGSQLLMDASPDRPITLFLVEIPRTYSAEIIRGDVNWFIQTDGEEELACYPLSITRKDARWEVILSPNRNGEYL